MDRAARNLFDYVELERLESDHGVPFISVSQPTENTPAGRMMRRTLANMASFYTEQQSVDVREGIARRVAEGWFPTAAPYGYRNVRKDGRGVVEVDPEDGPKVSRVFRLFAYEGLTLDTLAERLADDGVAYRPSSAKWPRSTLHALLRHRAYIGEVPHRGEWHPGRHEPLTDRETWDRVQTLLGSKVYRSHELVYAGGLIACGHCGHAITGERVKKKLKAGENRVGGRRGAGGEAAGPFPTASLQTGRASFPAPGSPAYHAGVVRRTCRRECHGDSVRRPESLSVCERTCGLST